MQKNKLEQWVFITQQNVRFAIDDNSIEMEQWSTK